MRDFFKTVVNKAQELTQQIEENQFEAYSAVENMSAISICQRIPNSASGIKQLSTFRIYTEALNDRLAEMSKEEIRSLGKKCLERKYLRAAQIIKQYLDSNF